MVFTKKMMCRSIIDKETETLGYRPTEANILQSSTLAVAMEYLGLIRDESLKEYAASRGGCFAIVDMGSDCKIMSFRELLSVLPD